VYTTFCIIRYQRTVDQMYPKCYETKMEHSLIYQDEFTLPRIACEVGRAMPGYPTGTYTDRDQYIHASGTIEVSRCWSIHTIR